VDPSFPRHPLGEFVSFQGDLQKIVVGFQEAQGLGWGDEEAILLFVADGDVAEGGNEPFGS
jgi:hypothetical protein